VDKLSIVPASARSIQELARTNFGHTPKECWSILIALRTLLALSTEIDLGDQN
jgi:hypothetical protein